MCKVKNIRLDEGTEREITAIAEAERRTVHNAMLWLLAMGIEQYKRARAENA